MSKTVFIDQQSPGVTNLALPYYSKWRYTFNNSQDWSGCDIAVQQLSLFYSWPNFSASYGNLTGLSYSIQTGLGVSPLFSVTIPPGFYAFEDARDTPASIKIGTPPNSINGLIWQTMYANGHYLVDTNDNPFFFLELQVNEAAYKVAVVSTVVPHLTTFPVPAGNPYTGFTNPAGLYVGGQTTGSGIYAGYFPFLTLTSNLYPFFGIVNPNTPASVLNPSSLQFQIVNGTVTPLLITATSAIVTVNVASDPSSNRPDQILQVPVADKVFGEQINVEPKNLAWVPCATGPFSNLDITFFDPQGQLLQMADPQNFISLMVRDRNDDGFVTGTTNVRKRRANNGGL